MKNNNQQTLSVPLMTKLLKKAEVAHGKYEKKIGKRDQNWPEWYAKFIVKKIEKRGAGQ